MADPVVVGIESLISLGVTVVDLLALIQVDSNNGRSIESNGCNASKESVESKQNNESDESEEGVESDVNKQNNANNNEINDNKIKPKISIKIKIKCDEMSAQLNAMNSVLRRHLVQ